MVSQVIERTGLVPDSRDYGCESDIIMSQPESGRRDLNP